LPEQSALQSLIVFMLLLSRDASRERGANAAISPLLKNLLKTASYLCISMHYGLWKSCGKRG
jgi:hypothetical protein